MSIIDTKKPHIFLIQPPGWASQNPPLGLALLKSSLNEKGFNVKVKDLNIILWNLRHGIYRDAWEASNGYYTWERESCVRRMFDYYADEIMEFIYSVLEAEPEVIGLSAHCSSFIAARLLATKFKQFSPSTRIVFGGPQVAGYTGHWEGLIGSGIADGVIFGEGEESLAEYLKTTKNSSGMPVKGAVYRSASGAVVNGGPRDLIPSLDTIPFADFSDFDLSLYANKRTLPTYFSRGCINRCIFCTENKFFPRFRHRSGARVFNDIMHQLSAYPDVKYFRMHDSVSNGNIAELEKLCDLLIDNKVNIRFNLENAVIRKEMDGRLCAKLKKAGCDVVGYGLESPSKPLLRSVGKTACLDADFDKVVSDGARAGLVVGVNMMFGLPGETKADYEGQLDFLKRHHAARRNMIINPALNFCYFPEGSAVHSDPSRFGIDMSLGALYWSEVSGTNTFTERLAKFEDFCSLADSLGYTNLFEITRSVNRNEMLGNYYYKKGALKEALRFLRKSFETEIKTMEIAGSIADIYNKGIVAKDGFYDEIEAFLLAAGSGGISWLDKINTERDLNSHVASRTASDAMRRIGAFVRTPPPELGLSVASIKKLVKYVLLILKGDPGKNHVVRALVSMTAANRSKALEKVRP